MAKVRLTTAQAIIRFLGAQSVRIDSETLPLFHGVFAIFGHGNVAALGEALQPARRDFPVFRAHNEQAMAHAAIAFAKASNRRRMMACTTSVGPGATNMVTAAALAHVNRLPVLLLPGDTFAGRRPDPVLQQVEDFGDPTVTANDCFRPVSRYWDRITRPEQLLRSLPSAISVLTDPADCGPVTLALPQDVQAEAFDFPEEFFAPVVQHQLRAGADEALLRDTTRLLREARRPLIIAGGGVHYSAATDDLAGFAAQFSVPVAETQAGKGALAWNHAWNAGAIGVTGSSAANTLAAEADLIVALGTRLQDFTTASGTLFSNAKLISVNVCRHDAIKHRGLALQGDAGRSLREITANLGDRQPDTAWSERVKELCQQWNRQRAAAVASRHAAKPSDAEVIGVVNENAPENATVVCAAGGLPGELHKLWQSHDARSYHLEYGYSCMGYEIAAGLGVKMALPTREVIVMVGDGSYLMLNSEIATSIALNLKFTIVLLDNRGFGCINRLQQSCGLEPFNNLLEPGVEIDFVAHARALGAHAEKVADLEGLEPALRRAFSADRTAVVVIDTDPDHATQSGGAWWDVPVAEGSASQKARDAYSRYRARLDKL
jgi:3D-(3,5/4)-trihydroxycyclohexane-1,2-dione acylhydrolase (decyclizing)